MNRKIISEIKKGIWWQARAGGEFQLYFYPAWGFSRMKEFYPEVRYWAVSFSHRKEHVTQFMKEEDSIHLTGYLFKLYKRDKLKFRKMIQSWERDTQKMFDWLERYSPEFLSGLSKGELYDAFSEFGIKISEIWGRSLILEGNGTYFEKVFLPKIEKATRMEGGLLSSKISVLTAPIEDSFFSKEKLGILRLALDFRKLKISPKISIKDLGQKYPAFFKELVLHQKNYFWLENDYSDSRIISLAAFLKKINEVLSKNTEKEISAEIREIGTKKKLLKKKAEVKKFLRISDELFEEIYFFRVLGEWQDKRKKMNLMSGHFLTLFIKEISRRIGIDYRLGYSLLETEIERFLLGGKKPNMEKLKSRRKFFLIFLYSNQQIEIIENKREALFYEKLFESCSPESQENKNEIYGMVASSGKNSRVLGIVRVIINAEKKNIKKGEILVTSMTRP